ncbi:unnamed protein product [Strongylus vulgaris]|uniref:Uncharacterized protein n=1 Tax=Strongylus vulgaris TaxID=40348 RepID=A0A3P7LNQ0_STRVU|nr:unnamed protein product [Strongylus vulgaris]
MLTCRSAGYLVPDSVEKKGIVSENFSFSEPETATGVILVRALSKRAELRLVKASVVMFRTPIRDIVEWLASDSVVLMGSNIPVISAVVVDVIVLDIGTAVVVTIGAFVVMGISDLSVWVVIDVTVVSVAVVEESVVVVVVGIVVANVVDAFLPDSIVIVGVIAVILDVVADSGTAEEDFTSVSDEIVCVVTVVVDAVVIAVFVPDDIIFASLCLVVMADVANVLGLAVDDLSVLAVGFFVVAAVVDSGVVVNLLVIVVGFTILSVVNGVVIAVSVLIVIAIVDSDFVVAFSSVLVVAFKVVATGVLPAVVNVGLGMDVVLLTVDVIAL